MKESAPWCLASFSNEEGSLLPTLISEEKANVSTGCSSLSQGELRKVSTIPLRNVGRFFADYKVLLSV